MARLGVLADGLSASRCPRRAAGVAAPVVDADVGVPVVLVLDVRV
jgi:hypothetical protein